MVQGMLKVMKDPSGALSFRAVLKKEMEVYVHKLVLLVCHANYSLIIERKI